MTNQFNLKRNFHYRYIFLIVAILIAILGFLFENKNLTETKNTFNNYTSLQNTETRTERLHNTLYKAVNAFCMYQETKNEDDLKEFYNYYSEINELLEILKGTSQNKKEQIDLIEAISVKVNLLYSDINTQIKKTEDADSSAINETSLFIKEVELLKETDRLVNDYLLMIENSEKNNKRANEKIYNKSLGINLLFTSLLIIIISLLLSIAVKTDKNFKTLNNKIDENNKTRIFNPGEQYWKNQDTDAIDRLNQNIQSATNFIKAISNENYNYTIEGITKDIKRLNSTNLIGELIKLREVLARTKIAESQRKQEDENRNWSVHGIAQFNDLLRKHDNKLDNISDTIIKYLVDYAKANQGGLFIVNDNDQENKFLELQAAFAYDRKKYLEKQIFFGEGLVGTCALEKQKIHLTKLPDDYIEISSGLGEANPKALLLVPLKLDNNILGVIEIASFKQFKPYQVDFIEKVGDAVASTISNVKNNVRTNKLLEKFKIQSEEMAAQEEEMRQNLEELQTTQEEAARKSKELEATVEAIDESLGFLELDKNGKVIIINQFLIDLLKIDENKLYGKHHRNLLNPEEATSKNYNDFWEKLRIGEIQIVERKYVVKGKEIWLKETFKAMIDTDEQISKIIAILVNISDAKAKQKQLDLQSKKLKAKETELQLNIRDFMNMQKEITSQQDELKTTNSKLQNNEKVLKNAIKKFEQNQKNLQLQLEKLEKELIDKQSEIDKFKA